MNLKPLPHYIDGRSKRRKKAPPPSYTGGRTYYSKDGYVLEKVPDHPKASRDGLVLQHRLIVEKEILKAPLPREYTVHHVDGNKTNNHPDNLEILTNAEHAKVHSSQRGDIDQYDEKMVADTVTELGLLKAARKLRVSTSSILSRYPYLRKIQKLTRDRVRKEAQNHTTLGGLAKALGVTPLRLKRHYPDLVPKQRVLTEDEVRTALQGRTTKEAAGVLGVHPQTLYNNFYHLLNRRKSPVNPEDPQVIQTVLHFAADPRYGYRDLAIEHGISSRLAAKICCRQGVEWKTYRGPRMKPTPAGLISGDLSGESPTHGGK
jgi:hypothetical protein